ncbi:hypothetical protein [Halorientalis sp.]|uniref:hypothetical protein n=1 Tax=Halorientalis sp. TaxID=1931229 RepID=UPI002629AE00|nr:hypothetical protein [Halorientalis sp.]
MIATIPGVVGVVVVFFPAVLGVTFSGNGKRKERSTKVTQSRGKRKGKTAMADSRPAT